MGWGLILLIFFLIIAFPVVIVVWMLVLKDRKNAFELAKKAYDEALRGRNREEAIYWGRHYYALLMQQPIGNAEDQISEDIAAHPKLNSIN